MKHLNMLTKSLSCNEIWTKQIPPESCTAPASNDVDSALAVSKRHKSSDKLAKTSKTENHKTVIYFGDSMSSKKQHNQLQQQMKAQQKSANRANGANGANVVNGAEATDESSDLKHAQRLCDEMVFKRQQSSRTAQMANEIHSKCVTDEMVTIVNDVKVIKNESMVKHLKTVLEEKCQQKNEKSDKPSIVETRKDESVKNSNEPNVSNSNDARPNKIEHGKKLPPFIESIVNGVINIKIDDSFDAATKLVRSIENADTEDADSFDAMEDGNDIFLDVGGEVNNMYLDWSFVQDWRSR